MVLTSFFQRTWLVFASAILLRAALLVYGHFQDQFSALKYTDIDYYVFTDAARYIAQGKSPYLRDTYRYTPLLAWLLLPATRGGWWFLFGKGLFATCDVVAGWFILSILRSSYRLGPSEALKYASLWLLNPMVAQISTRGSSEGLLAVLVTALLWATLRRQFLVAGVFLGLAVHFKIYPFIYAAPIALWIDGGEAGSASGGLSSWSQWVFNRSRVQVGLASLATFACLTYAMYAVYGGSFIGQTYLYHLIRTDHRHNFSPYNLLLYHNASPAAQSRAHPEALAFLPQLLLSAVLIPLKLARRDLASCMLAQTFCFATFNKVCTSQYFLWYLVFLPFYLPNSSFLKRPGLGVAALSLWVLGQAMWLQQGYQLEFQGRSRFVPGLWRASLALFLANTWLLGVVICDVRQQPPAAAATRDASPSTTRRKKRA